MTEAVMAFPVASQNIRNGPYYNNSTKSKEIATLDKSQEYKILGLSIDPDGINAWNRRYQIVVPGQDEAWCSASAFDLTLPEIKNLPLLQHATLISPIKTVLKRFGVVPIEDVDEDDAMFLIHHLWKDRFRLDITGTADNVSKARQLIETLEYYALVLGQSNNGAWKLSELETVIDVVKQTAQATATIVEQVTGINNERYAFQLMYGPTMIRRHSGKYVKLTWYAENSQGFEINFSDSSFFDGTQSISTVPGWEFSSSQLIAHEMAHSINWRRRILHPVSRNNTYPSNVYVDTMMNADSMNTNDGMTFAVRSSTHPAEIVTDAFAHYNLDEFSEDANGEKRKEQIIDLLKQCVEHRFGVDKTQLQTTIKNKGKTDTVEDSFALLNFEAFEKIRLGEEPEKETIPMTTTTLIARPIFKANAVNFVQNVRAEFPELKHNTIEIHVTLMFKMLEGLTVEQWNEHMANVLQGQKPIAMAFRCAIPMPDLTRDKTQRTHVLLVPDEGFSDVLKLHNALYTGKLAAKLLTDVPYIPQITIGYHEEADYCHQVVEFINSKGTIIGNLTTLILLQDSGDGWQEVAEYTLGAE